MLLDGIKRAPLRTGRRSRSASACRPSQLLDLRALVGRSVGQHPRREGHRREGRGRADPRVGRSREPARARRRGSVASARAKRCSGRSIRRASRSSSRRCADDVPLPLELEAAALPGARSARSCASSTRGSGSRACSTELDAERGRRAARRARALREAAPRRDPRRARRAASPSSRALPADSRSRPCFGEDALA